MTDEPTASLESCPACGEPALAPWRQATPASAAPGAKPPHGYSLLRCSRCGSAALLDPAPTNGAELYESGSYGSAPRLLDRPLEPLRRAVDRARLRLLGGVAPGERVLELGAGRGRLVALMAEEGADVRGIEPSRISSAAARERGAPVETLPLERAEVDAASRDLVVLWHVLEHLDDPAQALLRVRGWIADDGRVVISVPNLDSLQARFGGDRWFHQDVPRHRVLFTRDGLDRLLRRTGFTPARTRQGLIDQGVLGMWLSLLNRLTVRRDVPYRFLKRDLRYESRSQGLRDALVTVLLGPPLLVAALALEAGAIVAGRGGSLIVEARPD